MKGLSELCALGLSMRVRASLHKIISRPGLEVGFQKLPSPDQSGADIKLQRRRSKDGAKGSGFRSFLNSKLAASCPRQSWGIASPLGQRRKPGLRLDHANKSKGSMVALASVQEIETGRPARQVLGPMVRRGEGNCGTTSQNNLWLQEAPVCVWSMSRLHRLPFFFRSCKGY